MKTVRDRQGPLQKWDKVVVHIEPIRAKVKLLRGRVERYFESDQLPFSALVQIVLPILWEQGFLAVFSVVSVRLLAADGQGAVSVVNMMSVVGRAFTCICMGLVTGGAVLVAQCVGAGKMQSAARGMLQSIGLCTALTAALSAVLLVCRVPVVGYLLPGAAAEIVTGATVYFAAFCVSFPLFAFYQSFAGAQRGLGRTRLAWWLTFLVSGAELGLTGVFLLGLKMGVRGIALALVLSRLLGAMVAAGLLLGQRAGLCRADWQPDRAMLRAVLVIALPLALEQFFFNSGKAFSQRFIAGYGTGHMAAHGVVNAIFDLINIPQATLREASVIVVGMCAGSGDYALAKRYIYKFLRTVRRAMVYLMPVTIPLSIFLVLACGLSSEANRLTAMSLALIFTFGPLFLAGSFTLPSGLRAGGDAAYVSAVALFCMWALRVALSYLFTRVIPLGVVGLNLAMVAEWIVRSALYRLRLKGTAWCGHRLLAGR